jgi:4-aminobutyrate aminotransferase/(S)-3-amino-2-methylpropionate transaminase
VSESHTGKAEKFFHTCFGVSAYELYHDLAEKLIELFPHGDATKVMLPTAEQKAWRMPLKLPGKQQEGRRLFASQEHFTVAP